MNDFSILFSFDLFYSGTVFNLYLVVAIIRGYYYTRKVFHIQPKLQHLQRSMPHSQRLQWVSIYNYTHTPFPLRLNRWYHTKVPRRRTMQKTTSLVHPSILISEKPPRMSKSHPIAYFYLMVCSLRVQLSRFISLLRTAPTPGVHSVSSTASPNLASARANASTFLCLFLSLIFLAQWHSTIPFQKVTFLGTI